jgi:hypothetical protein
MVFTAIHLRARLRLTVTVRHQKVGGDVRPRRLVLGPATS